MSSINPQDFNAIEQQLSEIKPEDLGKYELRNTKDGLRLKQVNWGSRIVRFFNKQVQEKLPSKLHMTFSRFQNQDAKKKKQQQEINNITAIINLYEEKILAKEMTKAAVCSRLIDSLLNKHLEKYNNKIVVALFRSRVEGLDKLILLQGLSNEENQLMRGFSEVVDKLQNTKEPLVTILKNSMVPLSKQLANAIKTDNDKYYDKFLPALEKLGIKEDICNALKKRVNESFDASQNVEYTATSLAARPETPVMELVKDKDEIKYEYGVVDRGIQLISKWQALVPNMKMLINSLERETKETVFSINGEILGDIEFQAHAFEAQLKNVPTTIISQNDKNWMEKTYAVALVLERMLDEAQKRNPNIPINDLEKTVVECVYQCAADCGPAEIMTSTMEVLALSGVGQTSIQMAPAPASVQKKTRFEVIFSQGENGTPLCHLHSSNIYDVRDLTTGKTIRDFEFAFDLQKEIGNDSPFTGKVSFMPKDVVQEKPKVLPE